MVHYVCMDTKNLNKNLIIICVCIILAGGVYYFINNNKVVPVVSVPTSTSTSVVYTNTELGFTFSLPQDWSGYSVVQSTWTGNNLTATTTIETGPTLLLRNPNWTAAVHYEDIPIMVFTLAQWDSYTAGNFATSAAPISATELGRNNLYVFALPPRWDFDYSQGYQEAESILQTNPLHPVTI